MSIKKIDKLRASLRREPASARFAELAELLRGRGELEEAEAVLRSGLTYHPGSATGRMVLAGVLIERGRPDEGISVLESVVEQHPDLTKAWRLLATTHEASGNVQRADQCRAMFTNKDALPKTDEQGLPSIYRTETMARVLDSQGLKRQAGHVRRGLKKGDEGRP